jgi:hypothetical protein
VRRTFRILAILFGSLAIAAEAPDQALAIMTKVAANTTAATDARRQYVYQQRVRARMSHPNGQLLRKETREYKVVPQESTTEKTLVSFSGEYRDGKIMAPYSQPGVKDKGDEGDREEIQRLVDDLVNAKGTRDGIPRTLFPLRAEEFEYYKFSLKGEATLRER